MLMMNDENLNMLKMHEKIAIEIKFIFKDFIRKDKTQIINV